MITSMSPQVSSTQQYASGSDQSGRESGCVVSAVVSEKAGTAANVEDENSWCKEVVERGRGRGSGNGEQSGNVGWMVGRQKKSAADWPADQRPPQ